MLFSYKELKRLAGLNDETTLENVVKAINSIGFEVESTKKFGDVEGIKFGKVLTVEKNPNAEKLNICLIKFSDKERIIQTNAANVSVGMNIVAFIPGARSGEIIFDSKTMQGVESEGMLSSLNELGVNKELLRDGMSEIIQAYEDITLDMDPIEYLGLNDSIIDVDILSNRSDAQSYLIMARELAAYFGTNPLTLSINKSTFDSLIKVTPGMHSKLSFIEGKNDFSISLKEQILLAKSGIKSINNIVDLTNLILIMSGQPTHAYDKSLVGNEFSTKISSEKVIIFGDREIQLEENLVVTSDSISISLAGVIGFEKTGVVSDTKDFILELGNFNIREVRKTLKTIKLNTQAGIQSSKILANGTMKLAIDYISTKLNTFSKEINFKVPINNIIDFSLTSLSQVAGFDISASDKYEKTINSLEILGFKINDNKVEIPSYRHDINTQQDLNEEFLRFYGYDNIPLIPPKITPFKVKKYNDYKESISAIGYDEVVTYTLTSNEKNIFNPFGFHKTISLETFVSKEREEIRNSQIPSILEIVEYNIKRNLTNLNIFSEGMINNGKFTTILASTTKNFNEMKQDVVNLLPEGIKFIQTTDSEMHPGISADIILNNEKIGTIGSINPKIVNSSILIAEFIKVDLQKKIKYNTYSTKPLKNRDVTFELKDKENIGSYIFGINIVEKKVIDTFIKDSINKVTVRFTGTKEQIEEIDNKFN